MRPWKLCAREIMSSCFWSPHGMKSLDLKRSSLISFLGGRDWFRGRVRRRSLVVRCKLGFCTEQAWFLNGASLVCVRMYGASLVFVWSKLGVCADVWSKLGF